MDILGISAFYHDSAACLLRDGELVAAAQEERFTRVKHDFNLFWGQLREGGLMVFHDVLVDKKTKWGRCGVKRFWREVEQGRRNKRHIRIGVSAGLGILEK